MDLDLHLVGSAVSQASIALVTIQRLADEGLGARRTTLQLESVECLDGHGLSVGKAVDVEQAEIRSTAPRLVADDLIRPGDENAQQVRVRFVAPTAIREGKSELREPFFGPLVRRLRARLGALATFYGEGPLPDDARQAGTEAEAVRLLDSRVQWVSVSRLSTRTRQRHPLGGMYGEAVYEGPLQRFIPMLRLGELLHVGRHASFGLGRIEVDVLG